MTGFEEVYDAFFSKILDDEWDGWTQEEIYADCRQLLEGAIPFFKFPRISLERTSAGFNNTLGAMEIQILATYMKCEWYSRSIDRWENIRSQYSEVDFSPANFLEKITNRYATLQKTAQKLESNYYRSVNGTPFDYTSLAGGGK
jgi:hypothetical protein